MHTNAEFRVLTHRRFHTAAEMDAQAQRKSKVFTRREVEDQIANGRAIVIVDSKVLKVDAWMQYHPGGDKAIRHMVGRDATDEVTRYARSYSMVHCSI